MATFSERLKSLRKSNKMTQQQLADIFFLDKSSISKYENGKNIPENELLKKIADYFNVSIDYLLGRDNIASQDNSSSSDKLITIDLSEDVDVIFDKFMKSLEAKDDLHMEGTPISDKSFELLKTAIKTNIELLKKK